MTETIINVELRQQEDKTWDAELTIEDGDEKRTKSQSFDNLHEAMAELQTTAIFEVASAEARENAKNVQ